MPDTTRKTADAPATTPGAAEAKTAEESAPAPRPGAGESTNPDVHFLIANRRGHEMVLEDPGATEENRRHAQAAIAAIDKQLKDHGYR